MIRKLIQLTQAILVVLGIVSIIGFFAGCDKIPNPTTPTPTVCEDAKATNNGDPLPCVYPPPEQSFVTVKRTIPLGGATLSNSKKEYVRAYVEYGISQAHMDEARAVGASIVAIACLSVDGVNLVTTSPVCYTRPTVGWSGENEHLLSISVGLSPEAKQTNYIISYLKFRTGTGQSMREREITRSVFAGTFYWKE